MSAICISHPGKKITGTFSLPASKSISNRLLVIQALSKEQITIDNLSDADDSLIMQAALKQRSGTINIKNAGTCMRFLTAYFASVPSDVILDGNERMYERPVAGLVNALRQMGADIEYGGKEGFPPLIIKGKMLYGGKITVDASHSSQFITALMLIAPVLHDGLQLSLSGQPSSRPYLKMTEKLMYDCGIVMSRTDKLIDIPPQEYRAGNFFNAPDWSAASYWYAMSALSKGGEITLKGLAPSDLQGDSAIANYMERFGVSTTYTKAGAVLTKHEHIVSHASYNMPGEPDLVPAMAVALAALNVDASFENIAGLRIKESDRIEALKAELNKCGFAATAEHSSLKLTPVKSFPSSFSGIINTYGDHRIAMAFSALALVFDEVCIEEPEVVEKSYPGFWEELKHAGFIIR